METVYIETSVISYLVADPSHDLLTAANQQVTRDWWQQRRIGFVCVASQEVVAEASPGGCRTSPAATGSAGHAPALSRQR